jgi:RNA polymerase sigma-70 factor (ECF subfamily)
VQLYDVNAEPEKAEGAIPMWNETQDTPETEVLRKLDAQTIQQLVAALPDVFREVIVLRELEDLSYREIAEIVSTPVGTVMSRLARARALLREAWLKTEYNEEPAGRQGKRAGELQERGT